MSRTSCKQLLADCLLYSDQDMLTDSLMFMQVLVKSLLEKEVPTQP